MLELAFASFLETGAKKKRPLLSNREDRSYTRMTSVLKNEWSVLNLEDQTEQQLFFFLSIGVTIPKSF